MNKTIFSSILFCMLLMLCFMNKRIIRNISSTSIEYVNNIKSSNLENENKKKKFYEFKDYWNTKSQTLNMLIHHDTIDKIDEQISELESAIEYGNKENISKNINNISEMLDYTIKMDSLTPENIL